MALTTSLYYGGGIGNQSNIERLAVQHAAHAGQSATVSITMHNANADDVTQPTDIVSLARNGITYTALHGQADAHQFSFSATGGQSPVALNYFVVQGTAQGESREP